MAGKVKCKRCSKEVDTSIAFSGYKIDKGNTYCSSFCLENKDVPMVLSKPKRKKYKKIIVR